MAEIAASSPDKVGTAGNGPTGDTQTQQELAYYTESLLASESESAAKAMKMEEAPAPADLRMASRGDNADSCNASAGITPANASASAAEGLTGQPTSSSTSSVDAASVARQRRDVLRKLHENGDLPLWCLTTPRTACKRAVMASDIDTEVIQSGAKRTPVKRSGAAGRGRGAGVVDLTNEADDASQTVNLPQAAKRPAASQARIMPNPAR